MMEDEHIDWRSVAPPIVFESQAVMEAFAEMVYDIHAKTVQHAGFDLSPTDEDRYKQEKLEQIESVLYPIFGIIYGQPASFS
ncbi:hypothetical protein GFD17_02450 [Bifidobacterium sp. SMB2]|uniref:Uncharacterized protein n=1 Tax=Bifidobacterium saimiriisciurei TaxID=2661627 RepID=A0ABX0CCE7_9BIFI|nr:MULTISPECIES: hypothetical protein [Bifidobacterium]NEG95631.1 hypothetical protein [Bifidobacterium sp. SMB2]NEH11944.1 hypothetical protein [Bifidobacterium saimiriisciurei]